MFVNKPWLKSSGSKSLAVLVLLAVVYAVTPDPKPVAAQTLELLEQSDNHGNEGESEQMPTLRYTICSDTSEYSVGATELPYDYGCDGAVHKLEPPVTTTSQPQLVQVAMRLPVPPPATTPTPPVSPGVEQWRSLVATYFAAGDVELALKVIDCESGGDPNAPNPTSGAAGLFQHIPRYWADRSAAAGWTGADIFDPTANVAVAAWLVYFDKLSWGHWNASAHCWS